MSDDIRAADGRTRRRDRNREAVLDAVIELFHEGEVDLDPEIVAARSGVSARSVYRYFDDREALAREAMDRHASRFASLLAIRGYGQGTLEDRVANLLDARLALHDAVGVTARMARVLAPRQEVFAERLEWNRLMLREQVEGQLADEVRGFPAQTRRHVMTAVDALLQFDTLDLLRVHRGLTVCQTHATLTTALLALLRPS